jgi:hypothetical protein
MYDCVQASDTDSMKKGLDKSVVKNMKTRHDGQKC